jgi:glutamate racemase
MNNHYSIGVFDSGIGGLTVLKELKKKLPHENFIYFGDTARVPYGTKSEHTIRNFASEITDFLIQNHIKILVVACNTVSALALEYLKHQYSDLPVIGVIQPGAKKAVETTKNRRVGIIGTVATIRSMSYSKAIHAIDPRIEVTQQACPLFVPLVESGWTKNRVAELTAQEYLTPLKKRKIDTLVLGCTHYPLLKGIISGVMKGVTLVDSATETAEMTSSYLQKTGMCNPSKRKGKTEFWLSDISPFFIDAAKSILGEKEIRIKLRRM